MDRPAWPLGLYCERTQYGFWAEPLNTWTNLAFLLVAFATWRQWRADARGDVPSLALVALIAAIGAGSFAFHAAPGPLTVRMDVAPIQAFVLMALFLALRRYLDFPPWLAVLGLGAFFFGGAWGVGQVGSPMLRSSISYIPPLAAMILVAALIIIRLQRRMDEGRRGGRSIALESVARTLAAASIIFALSLTFRTLDQPLCRTMPFGLHFIWHLLNAVVVGMLAGAQIRFVRAARMDP